MHLTLKTAVCGNFRQVFQCFDRELFEKLAPAAVPFQAKRFDGCRVGDEVHVALGPFGDWVSEITEQSIGEHEIHFVDEGRVLPPPLRKWRHVHRLQRLGDRKTLIVDEIHYDCGSKAQDLAVFPILYGAMAYRKPIYRSFFKSRFR